MISIVLEEGIKEHLKKNWGTYAKGAVALGAGAYAFKKAKALPQYKKLSDDVDREIAPEEKKLKDLQKALSNIKPGGETKGIKDQIINQQLRLKATKADYSSQRNAFKNELTGTLSTGAAAGIIGKSAISSIMKRKKKRRIDDD